MEKFAHAQTVDTRPLFPCAWPGYEANYLSGIYQECNEDSNIISPYFTS